MKMLISIFVLFLVANCNQKENDLKFIEDYINANNKKLEQIYISYKSETTKYVLGEYLGSYNYFLKENISSADWFNEKHEWPFTKEELNNLEVDGNRYEWNFGEVHPTLGIFNDFKGKKKKEIESFIRNQSQIITISKPIFNSEKTKAMFYYTKSIGVNSFVDTCIVVLVKEKDKWLVAGKVPSREVH